MEELESDEWISFRRTLKGEIDKKFPGWTSDKYGALEGLVDSIKRLTGSGRKPSLLRERTWEDIIRTLDLSPDLEKALRSTRTELIRRERALRARQTSLLERATPIPYAQNDLPTGQDLLQFTNYAIAFAELITNDEVKPPLTVGIYGPWGSGKTFLIEQIKKQIVELLASKKRSFLELGRPKRKKILIVDFNAWSYNSSDILWAGMVVHIFKTIEKQLGRGAALRISIQRNWAKQKREIVSKMLYYGVLISAICIILFLLLMTLDQAPIAQLVPLLGVPALIELARQLIPLLIKPQSEQVRILFNKQSYEQERGLMARIHEDISALTKALPADTRIAVMIDDLDRCKPERAVEVLEAINLLLNLNKFIVFIAVDTRVITSFVESIYEGSFLRAGITGYEYLDKIVQIPFSIPKAQPQELRAYLNALIEAPPNESEKLLLSPLGHANSSLTDDVSIVSQMSSQSPRSLTMHVEQATQQFNEVPFTINERRAFRSIEEYLNPNPRHIKRLVNIYRLVRTLALKRGLPIMSEHPEKVVLWLLLNQQWPTLMAIIVSQVHLCAEEHQSLTELYHRYIEKYDLEEIHQPFEYYFERFATLIECCHTITCEDILVLQQLAGNFTFPVHLDVFK